MSAGGGPDIKLIASDVDGTLLDSQQKLSPKIIKAVQLCRSIGIQVQDCSSCSDEVFTESYGATKLETSIHEIFPTVLLTAMNAAPLHV